MSRLRSFCILLAATLLLSGHAVASDKAKKEAPTPPSAYKAPGVIVDCGEFLLTGWRGPDRRETQSKSIDEGHPACFISDEGGEMFVLVDNDGQAREKFQPTTNFILSTVIAKGTVYRRGAFSALVLESVERTGPYTDRKSRQKNNPEPNKAETNKDPHKIP